jgi:putative ABC transport system permease protein
MRVDLVSQLGTGGRGVIGSAGRRALVAAQVALAVVIVAAAGLLTRSLLGLQSVDMGLSAHRLVFVDLAIPPATATDRSRHAQFLEQVIERLETVPLIAAATPVNVPPYSGRGGWDVPRFTAEGQSVEKSATNPSLNLESVHPNYFETLGITLVRGRMFTNADREGALDVAIVSEDVAARTWPGEDPLGKRLKMGGPASQDVWRTVVGVAAPTRYRELANARATLYLPAAQFLMTARMLVLRSAAAVDLVASLSRDQIRAVDPDVQVVRVAPFGEMLAGPLARPRFHAFLLTVFGVTALVLAAVGLYAVMAAFVRQRDREIGIRVALGATSAHVRHLVLGEALRLSGFGAIAGLAGAAAATRLVRGMLFEVDALDPSTLLGAALLLVATSVLASFLPMRRAARLDPATILRSE